MTTNKNFSLLYNRIKAHKHDKMEEILNELKHPQDDSFFDKHSDKVSLLGVVGLFLKNLDGLTKVLHFSCRLLKRIVKTSLLFY